jgi:hypothetical protein
VRINEYDVQYSKRARSFDRFIFIRIGLRLDTHGSYYGLVNHEIVHWHIGSIVFVAAQASKMLSEVTH